MRIKFCSEAYFNIYIYIYMRLCTRVCVYIYTQIDIHTHTCACVFHLEELFGDEILINNHEDADMRHGAPVL